MKVLIYIIAALITFPAYAATQDWFWPGLSTMVVLSTLLSLFVTHKFKQVQTRALKILVFGLFFWVAMFAQGIIYAVFIH